MRKIILALIFILMSSTTFAESVEWLMDNFPELEVERRLQELDKSIHFAR